MKHYVKQVGEDFRYIGLHGARPREAYAEIPAEFAHKALRFTETRDEFGGVILTPEIDEVKEAARLRAIADEEQEKLARESVRAERISRIQNSKPNLDRMTLPQLREVVADIIEHLGM